MRLKTQMPRRRLPVDLALPVTPMVEFDRTEDAQGNVPRWEDDGGPTIEAQNMPTRGDQQSPVMHWTERPTFPNGERESHYPAKRR